MLHPGHPVRFRTGLRGFTLLEVLFATAILAVAGYYLFESFLGTTRLATTSAATLGEVSVGRTVLEQFVDQVANDPTCIGRLCHGKPWTHWGYVVRPKAPITAPDGQPISEACPYTQY
ncbi:MAG: prepilin-type N-terminal cleavage/methylation domain-containing protein, partial [Candidatus Riflebacteria bacterium]|nr:prepilin-type N-terminal cleavage/methylation domain-containing protein [Candidatus Riflebacteria bacterium]